MLRVGEVKHHRAGEASPPVAYTIEEDVVNNIHLQFASGHSLTSYMYELNDPILDPIGSLEDYHVLCFSCQLHPADQ